MTASHTICSASTCWHWRYLQTQVWGWRRRRGSHRCLGKRRAPSHWQLSPSLHTECGLSWRYRQTRWSITNCVAKHAPLEPENECWMITQVSFICYWLWLQVKKKWSMQKTVRLETILLHNWMITLVILTACVATSR